METGSVKGVEVFAVGEWNGDEYTREDLNEMVRAFEETSKGWPPFLKLGHSDKQKILEDEGLPAAGWITNLYMSGEKLMADFADIPKKIFELIKARAYRKVSSEIYWNVTVNGKKYPRLLGAVALLGSQMPGVENLADIISQYKNLDGELKHYDKSTEFELTETTIGKEANMEKTEKEIKLELELKAQAEKAEALETEKKQFAADLEAKNSEVEELKKFKAEAEREKADALVKAQEAEVKAFVADLKAEKLCSPAMESLVTELLGPKKTEYSVKIDKDEKKYSEKELLKETLKLFKAASEVNFEESSEGGKKGSEVDDKAMDEKIKKYAADNKMSYGQAYRVIVAQSKK